VVDRFLFRLPGLQTILRLTCAIEGSVDECVALLNPRLAKANSSRHRDEAVVGRDAAATNGDPRVEGSSGGGEVLLLSPGGVREALFSDEYYSVLWGKRRGFARIAINAKKPIYPVFTENIREGIRVVQYGKSWWRRIYEVTRLPIAIFYGYFPVKLRTYIGDPVYPREGETDEQLADRAREAIEGMISRYQWRPGNIIVALLQRFPWFDAWVQSRNAQNYHSRRRRDS
uniref:Acyltransferase n=1 Tax=Mesocestoides corti TaxID=53468 RepID=A0A5K3FL51_MESCO